MDPIKTADHLANQSDRYFVILVLLVLGMCVFFAVRWLVTRFENSEKARNESQKEQTVLLTGIIEKAVTVIAVNANHIQQHTEHVKDCTVILRKVDAHLDRQKP